MTDLHEMAMKAVHEAADEPGSRQMRAVRLLRERDGARRELREYIHAVTWAMEHPAAADLPDGSVVAERADVYIKRSTSPASADGWCPWHGTDGNDFADEDIDMYLRDGAVVLRVGYGKEG